MTLLAYRLRPLPSAVLTGLPIVLLTAAWWIGPRLGAAEASRLPQFVAVLLGLMMAFSVSRDVDAPEPVLAAAPHPYWRTPGLRVALWLIAAGVVVRLIVDVIEARASNPVPVEAVVSVAHADLLLVAGLSFVFSVRWGSFIGGASALVSLVMFAVAQKVWHRWPLRILDTVGMPRWQQTRTWLLLAGATCVAGGLLYLRARGLPIRLDCLGGSKQTPERPVRKTIVQQLSLLSWTMVLSGDKRCRTSPKHPSRSRESGGKISQNCVNHQKSVTPVVLRLRLGRRPGSGR